MKVKRIVFINRAPFNHLDLSFDDADVISLTGFNGAGKTTIMSYIVDAFYEVARRTYDNEFGGEKEGQLYRLSTNLNITIGEKSSLVYICFALNIVSFSKCYPSWRDTIFFSNNSNSFY